MEQEKFDRKDTSVWIKVSDRLPKKGKPVETKIENSYMGDWCFIQRTFTNGKWRVIDQHFAEFDAARHAPTHWHVL